MRQQYRRFETDIEPAPEKVYCIAACLPKVWYNSFTVLSA